MKSPFKFLDAYTLEDEKVFFGRKKEVDALYKMVFETPLILVYGFMGTGKTSLIKCGLASRFDGPDWYPFYIRRHNDFNEALESSLQQASRPLNGADTTALDRIDYIYKTYFRPVYLIFDQFEELFILGDEEEQQAFIKTIKTLVESDLPCKVILVMREEYLGNLYHFEKELPYIFDFKLRVEKMDNKKVKKVISDSFAEFNIQLEAPVEERLDQIVDKVSLGKSGIQLPYLQVYMDLFYREDYRRTYPDQKRREWEYPELVFTEKEIDEFGTIDQVLEKFLLEQEIMVSRELRKKSTKFDRNGIRTILNAFVSDEGTKKPVLYRGKGQEFDIEEAFNNQVPQYNDTEIYEALRTLENARLIRFTDDTIELAHDTLADIIHSKQSHEARKLKDIRNQLRTHYQSYQETGEYINEKLIAYYENFLPELNLTGELSNFIAESKTFQNARKKKEMRRLVSWIIALAVISVISIFSLFQVSRLSSEAKKTNEELNIKKGISDYISGLYNSVSNAFVTTKNDRTKAYINSKKLIKEAEEKAAKSKSDINIDVARQLKSDLFRDVAHMPFYKSRIPSNPNMIKADVYSADSTHYLLSWPKRSDHIEVRMLDSTLHLVQEEVIQIPIESEVVDFLLLPQKDQLIVANVAKEVQVWSLADSIHLLETIDMPRKVYCLGQSRRSTELYVGCRDGLHLISFRKNKTKRRRIQKFRNPVSLIASNKTDNRVAICELYADNIMVLDRNQYDKSKRKFARDTFHLGDIGVTDIDFSDNGRTLALAFDNGRAGLLDTQSKRITYELIGHESIISSIEFSDDERFLLTGSHDHKAIVWNKRGEPIKKLIGHEHAIFSASYIGQDYVLTAGEDDNMKLWNVESFAEKSFDLKGDVTHLSYHPEGGNIIACCRRQKGFFNVIDLENHHIWKQWQPLKRKSYKKGYFKSLFYSGDGEIVMGATNHLTSIVEESDTTVFVDLKSNKPHGIPSTSRILTVAKSGDYVAIADGVYNMILLRKKSDKKFHKKILYPFEAHALVFDTTGTRLFAGYEDGNIIVWNIDSLTMTDTLTGHTGKITDLKLSSDEQFLISGSIDNGAILWLRDANGSYLIQQHLRGHLSDVNAVDITTDNSKILTASSDHTVKLWSWKEEYSENSNPKENYLIEAPSFIRHLGDVYTAAFSPNGTHVATGSKDNTLKIWNIDSPEQIVDERIDMEQ